MGGAFLSASTRPKSASPQRRALSGKLADYTEIIEGGNTALTDSSSKMTFKRALTVIIYVFVLATVK